MNAITGLNHVERLRYDAEQIDRLTGDNWLKSNIDDLVKTARGQGLNAAQMAEADRILDEYKKRYSC